MEEYKSHNYCVLRDRNHTSMQFSVIITEQGDPRGYSHSIYRKIK